MSDEQSETDEEQEAESTNPWGETDLTNEGSGPGSDDEQSGFAGASASDTGQSTDTPGSAQSTGRDDRQQGTGGGETGWGDATGNTDQNAGTGGDGWGAAEGTGGTDGRTESQAPPRRSSETPSPSASSAVDQASRSNAETAERERPEETDTSRDGAFGMRNHTQDLIDVEFVLESDDQFAPDAVDAGGIIVTPDGDYIGLAEVTARSWSIHTQEKKEEILSAYQSGFLSSLGFYTQIVCYPTEFDMSEHIGLLEDRMRERENAADQSPLVQYGRQLYPRWLTNFVEENELTQREYYVIVRVDPSELRSFDESESLSEKVGERAEMFGTIVGAVEGLFSGSDGGADEASREECIREVRGRLNQVVSALRQIDVEVDPVRDRDRALSVVYHYYNDGKPDVSSFDTARRTEQSPDADLNLDDQAVDDLLRPEYAMNERGDGA